VRHALTPVVRLQLCTTGRNCAELCTVVRLTLRPDLTEQSQFILYNQVVDIQQPVKSGRWPWGRAGCDWSGQRIANWANKTRNGGRWGDDGGQGNSVVQLNGGLSGGAPNG
jgi:hypothetical protein